MKILIFLFTIVCFTTFNAVRAHHEEFRPINWDAIKEVNKAKDPFKPEYYTKFPYGFIHVLCDRTSKVIFDMKSLDEGFKEEFDKEIKKAKINNDIFAFILQCNAINDLRHPPEKDVMQYSKMIEAYKNAYQLSVDHTFGGTHNWFFKDTAVILLASQKAETISEDPDLRKMLLMNYYNQQK